MHVHLSTILLSTGVTIGFAMSNYSSMESDGSITVEVQLDGEIAPDRVVEVTLMTMDGTAIGRYYYTVTVYYHILDISML